MNFGMNIFAIQKSLKKLGYVADKNKKHDENCVYGSLERKEIIVKVYSDILQIRDEIQTKLINDFVTKC